MASIRSPLGALDVMAAANDLDGDTTQTLDLTGASGAVLVIQAGTLGTAGIDTAQISKDGGLTFAAAKIRTGAGVLVATGILNAAGVEPATIADAVFTIHAKDGQLNGPTLLRVNRGTAWVTGAPAVSAVRIG